MGRLFDQPVADQLVHLDRNKCATEVQLRSHLVHADLEFGIDTADHDQRHVLSRRKANEGRKSAARLVELSPEGEEIVEQSAKLSVAVTVQQLWSCHRQSLLLDRHDGLLK